MHWQSWPMYVVVLMVYLWCLGVCRSRRREGRVLVIENGEKSLRALHVRGFTR